MKASKELDFHDLLSAARGGAGSVRSRELLVRRSLHLVRPIAQHFSHNRTDLYEDLLQVGSIGLLHAIERFDPSHGKSFEAYANTLIAGEMRHYLRDHVPLVRPPRELVELRSRVLQAQALLGQITEGPVTPAAIAKLTDIPLTKVEEVLALEENFATMSLDLETECEGGAVRYQLVDSRYVSFELAAEDRMMLDAALGCMRTVSREVIEFTFYDDLTQTEIAKKLGISQMQVSRRLRAATGELWKTLNAKLF
jgi:RNA polymerase sigma-B factor